MKSNKINDWFIFGEWYNVSWFHACYFEGITATIKKFTGLGPSRALIEQNGDVQRIYLSRSEWTMIGENYFTKIIDDPGRLRKLLVDLRLAADNLKAFADHLGKIDVNKLSPSKRLALLRTFHKKHHRVWTLGQVTNVLELENSFLSDYLKAWLLNQNINDKKMKEYFLILSTPRELSAAQLEERAMLALVVKKSSPSKINKHWQKYRWIHFGWIGPSLELAYFFTIYDKLLRHGDAASLLRKVLSNDKKLIADKKKISEELKIPARWRDLFRLLEEILFTKAYRMDALFCSYDASQPLLKSIARDYNLSLGQIYFLDARWLMDMIKRKNVDVNKINRLGRYAIQFFDGRQSRVFIGTEAKQIVKPILSALHVPMPVTELTGDVAYPGRVRGRAVIVNIAAEMSKFRAGDILISYVTDPSLLPIMKKARAFVTNTGGLTCHAAIVARELHKPCVVGTKVATQVFKDGDMVEVDANKGIVKKIYK